MCVPSINYCFGGNFVLKYIPILFLYILICLIQGCTDKAKSLVKNLKDDDYEVQLLAEIALKEMGSEAKTAVPQLIILLEDEDRNVRKSATSVLSEIGPEAEAAIPHLYNMLKDENEYDMERVSAGKAIIQIENETKTVISYLIEILSDGDNGFTEREYAASVLSDIGEEARNAIPILIGILENEGDNEFFRNYITRDLGRFGPYAKAAEPIIIQLLNDPSERVQKSSEAALALIRQDIDAMVHLLQEDGDLGDRAWESLITLGVSSVPSLCSSIEKINGTVATEEEINQVIRIVSALHMIAMSEPATMQYSIPSILQATRRITNETVRTILVEYIASAFGKPSVPYILAFLQSEIQTPPIIDPDLTLTQGLISYIFISMMESDPGEIDSILKEIKLALNSSEGVSKVVIILILQNISQITEQVTPILQEELDSESDPDVRKQLEKTLNSLE